MISFGNLGLTIGRPLFSLFPFFPSRVPLTGLSLRLRCTVERELLLALLLLCVKFNDDVAFDDDDIAFGVGRLRPR